MNVKRWLKTSLPEGVTLRLGSARFSFRCLYCRVWRRIRSLPYPKNTDGKLFLHLGCGEVNDPRFVNIDVRPLKHVHYISRVENLSMFNDESADLIYASHCLEHFGHRQVAKVLAEWFRVLKRDGTLRLSVPDLDSLLELYKETGNDI